MGNPIPLGGGARLVFNDEAFPWIRKSDAVAQHLDNSARDLAAEATDAAQGHGGGQYGWESGGNDDRHVSLFYTDDIESVLDSALHSTMYKVIAAAEGH